MLRKHIYKFGRLRHEHLWEVIFFLNFYRDRKNFPVLIKITSVYSVRAHNIPGNIIDKISTDRHISVKCLGYDNNDKKFKSILNLKKEKIMHIN